MPHATVDEYDGLHPAELSRRISEIDLTNLRRRADTETVPPRYQAELFKAHADAERNEEQVAVAELAEGMKTPTNIPAPPPPTPDDHSTYPSDSESEHDETAAHTTSPPQVITFSDKSLHNNEDDVYDLPTPRAATFAGNPLRYTKEELFKLNPKVEVAPGESAVLTSGQKADEKNVVQSSIGQAPTEGTDSKKKKKKSSGKNKKPNPTGFEGKDILSNFDTSTDSSQNFTRTLLSLLMSTRKSVIFMLRKLISFHIIASLTENRPRGVPFHQ